jgi:outer membrane biosynthesis protein TonB
MSYNVQIDAESLEELTDKVCSLADRLRGTTSLTALPKVEPEVEAAAKPKPKPAPAAEETVAVKPKPKPKPAPAAEPEPEPEPAQDFTSVVRDVVLAVVDKHGRERMEAILKEYGIARASQVAPAQREELLAELREALAE